MVGKGCPNGEMFCPPANPTPLPACEPKDLQKFYGRILNTKISPNPHTAEKIARLDPPCFYFLWCRNNLNILP